MKKMLYIGLVICLLFTECVKKSEKFVQNNTNPIEKGFDYKPERYYFDIENKIPYTVYTLENVGHYEINYIPKTDVEKNYFENFENENNIKSLYDTINDLPYFSEQQQIETDKILRIKLNNKKKFTVVGKFIPFKYLNIENDEEFTIEFPYKLSYYKLDKNKWSLTKTEEILKYEDDKKNKKTISDIKNKYPTNFLGTWRLNCDNPIGITIKKDEIIMCIEPNIYYIHLSEIEKNTNKNYIQYKLDRLEGIGSQDVYSDNIFSDKEVALVKGISENKIEFNWLGFYNSENHKRQNTGSLISNKNPTILIRCDE